MTADKVAGMRTKRSDEPGRVLVFTGDGKGKSTAAMGLALRSLGNNMRVAMIQFIKGRWKPGEVRAAALLPGFELIALGAGFTWTKTADEHMAAMRQAWQKAQEIIRTGGHDVVILDEINYALTAKDLPVWEIFTPADVVALLRERPRKMHVVLTGRHAPDEIIAVADTVTEMRIVKHAYDQGRRAAKGIEF